MKVDLEELKRLHSASTPGEWKWDAGDIGNEFPVPYADIYVADGDTIILHFNDLIPEGKDNAKAIVALHNAWPSILAKLEAAQKKLVETEAINERLRRGLRYYASQHHMITGEWENPSGEPINIECCGDEATVENGGVAVAILQGKMVPFTDISGIMSPIVGEVYALAAFDKEQTE